MADEAAPATRSTARSRRRQATTIDRRRGDSLRRAALVHRRGPARDHHPRRARRSRPPSWRRHPPARAWRDPASSPDARCSTESSICFRPRRSATSIDARSAAAQRAALRQLDGGLTPPNRRRCATQLLGARGAPRLRHRLPRRRRRPDRARARIEQARRRTDLHALERAARDGDRGTTRARRRARGARRRAERRQVVAVQRAARRGRAIVTEFPARPAMRSKR